MLRKFIKWGLKLASALVSFTLIFFGLQFIFMPRFPKESSATVDAFNSMKENSIDVLFLGSSQMYFSVDSGMLKREYGINAFDFGAPTQQLTTTKFYFDYALNSQSPKLVFVEIGKAFHDNKKIDESKIAWSYSPISPSVEKYNSLCEFFNGDRVRAFKYTYTPLFIYHNRWNAFKKSEIKYILSDEAIQTAIYNRGYLGMDSKNSVSLSYFSNDVVQRNLPQESQSAILYMKKQCELKNIKLVFFKTPLSSWTKQDSKTIKQFMNDNNLEYLDLHDDIIEIGIDVDSDFSDSDHLNIYGSHKVTNYLAKVILQDLKQ